MVPLATDSLYKFVALSGLTAALGVTGYALSQGVQWSERCIDLRTEERVLTERVRSIGSEVIRLERTIAGLPTVPRVDSLRLRARDALLLDSLASVLDANDEEFREVGESIRHLSARLTELHEATVRLQGEQQKLAILEANLRRLKILFVLVVPAALVAMLVGFRLWYRRIQVHQDALIRHQASTPLDKSQPPNPEMELPGARGASSAASTGTVAPEKEE